MYNSNQQLSSDNVFFHYQKIQTYFNTIKFKEVKNTIKTREVNR